MAGVVLAAAGVGGALLAGLGGAGSGASADKEKGPPAARARVAAPTDGTSTEVGSAPSGVRCWTGRRAETTADCAAGPDAGIAGFRWVFPEADFDGCTETQQPRRTIRSCFVGDLRLAFSRWNDAGTGRAYYARDMDAAAAEAPGGRLVWRATRSTTPRSSRP